MCKPNERCSADGLTNDGQRWSTGGQHGVKYSVTHVQYTHKPMHALCWGLYTQSHTLVTRSHIGCTQSYTQPCWNAAQSTPTNRIKGKRDITVQVYTHMHTHACNHMIPHKYIIHWCFDSSDSSVTKTCSFSPLPFLFLFMPGQ